MPLKIYRMYDKCESNLRFIDKVVKNPCIYFRICIPVNTAMLHVSVCLIGHLNSFTLERKETSVVNFRFYFIHTVPVILILLCYRVICITYTHKACYQGGTWED